MAQLGEFGRARADVVGEPDTFRFHGEAFEVPAGISAVVLMDFVAATKDAEALREDSSARLERARTRIERARSDAERTVAQAAMDGADRDLISSSNDLLAGMHAYVRGCLPDEASWQRFNGVCRRDAVEIDELMDVCAAIFQAVAGRPTRRPSDSSDGPSNGGGGSTDGAGSPVETGGPRPLDSYPTVLGEVVDTQPETDNERARREMLAQMRSVDDLLRSGG